MLQNLIFLGKVRRVEIFSIFLVCSFGEVLLQSKEMVSTELKDSSLTISRAFGEAVIFLYSKGVQSLLYCSLNAVCYCEYISGVLNEREDSSVHALVKLKCT